MNIDDAVATLTKAISERDQSLNLEGVLLLLAKFVSDAGGDGFLDVTVSDGVYDRELRRLLKLDYFRPPWLREPLVRSKKRLRFRFASGEVRLHRRSDATHDGPRPRSQKRVAKKA